MIDIIVDAFTAKEEIAQAMAKPYTAAKMRLIIRKKINTAPGHTGLTYQMLSLLPEEAMLDFFKLMERMWRAKHVPEFWKLKGLIGLPRTKLVTGVNELRPIGLTRKLWTTMVTRRILGVFRRRLHDNHCGELANKETDTALIQKINLLEHIEDVNGAVDHEVSNTLLDFMSWDTAKVFNSVGNRIQYAAWRRMGDRVNIVSWLMNLDLKGSFVTMLFHTRRHWMPS
jgi:hypothetical protein